MNSVKIILFLGLISTSFLLATPDKEIIVIIPSYNNIQWYQKNLDSLFGQTFKTWKAVYIDDCSSDGTGSAVDSYIAQKEMHNQITVIHNKERMGALYNLYSAIGNCPDSAIIVTCDGDDWLIDPYVLDHINTIYQDSNVWMTYGTYMVYPDNTIGAWQAIPETVIGANSYRTSPWYASHLRTFYAKLFKLIQKEDLLYEGEFFKVTWDMAMMFPMLEMAGIHAKHIDRICYVYNQPNDEPV